MGGAVDFVGDVIGEAGDFVGDAIETVADNPELLALIAVPYLAPEMFALDAAAMEGLGGVGAFDVASSAIPGLTFDAATGAYTLADAGIGGLGLGTEAGGSFFTDMVNADSFDPNTFLPGNNPYDPIRDAQNYTNYAKDAYKIYNMLNPDSQTQVQNQFQQQNLYDPNSGEFDYGNALSPFMNQAKNLYDKSSFLNNLNAIESNPESNFIDTTKILETLKGLPNSVIQSLMTGPGALSTIGMIGAMKNQSKLNRDILQPYNENRAAMAAKNTQYTTPTGIASLPRQDITGLTPRTAANVVVRPGRADGGSMSNMLGEYMNLNSAMRNYKMRSKGGSV